LNKATVPDRYNLHRPEEIFLRASKAKIFSCLDLRAGFHQIPIHPDSQRYTSFWWGNQLWCFTRVAFGLRNAPATFQRVMDAELQQADCTDCAVAYIDDVLIWSENLEDHAKHLQKVFSCFEQCGLRIHPEKSVFASACVEFLGHNLSAGGVSPNQVKVQAIREMKPPTSVEGLRSVLGFFGYYRCYLPQYSCIAQPLNALLKKNTFFEWTSEQQHAFQQLKDGLCQHGIVLHHFDPQLPIRLYTDWSQKGISAVLNQIGAAGREHLVACISRSLNVHEKNYDAFKGELMAAVWPMGVFRFYLHGLHFTLVTDHQPLTWLLSNQGLTGQAARWAMIVQEYDFTVEHRPGKTNIADHPSRFPVTSQQDTSGARIDEVEPESLTPAAVDKAMLTIIQDTSDFPSAARAFDWPDEQQFSANPLISAMAAPVQYNPGPQAYAEQLC
jgi:hypothetical protein